jgi:hypothetical protein
MAKPWAVGYRQRSGRLRTAATGGPDAISVVGFGARSTQWGKLADGLGGLSPVQGSRAGLLNLFPFSTIFQMVSKDQFSKLQNMNLQMSKNFQT